MSVNRELPHIYILPEDKDDAQIAGGFLLAVPNSGQMQVLPIAGGWLAVLDRFCSFHAASMRTYPARVIVLLIDFDGEVNRVEEVRLRIPDDLINRVFVLGGLLEPVDLKRQMKVKLEKLGIELADECRLAQIDRWSHELLRHNLPEVERMRKAGYLNIFLSAASS